MRLDQYIYHFDWTLDEFAVLTDRNARQYIKSLHSCSALSGKIPGPTSVTRLFSACTCH